MKDFHTSKFYETDLLTCHYGSDLFFTITPQMFLPPWLQHFHLEQFVILDYSGIQVTKKDIAFVFLCEVLKISACKSSRFIHAMRSVENKGISNLVPYQFYELVRTYAALRNCTIPKFPDETGLIFQQIRHITDRLPVVELIDPLVRDYAKLVDSQFREKYSANILYNNQTASMIEISSYSVTTIDRETILASLEWRQIINSIVKSGYRNNLCM